jgi:hypothetical protein
MRNNRWLLMGALALTISIAGCNCGEVIEPDPDAGEVIPGRDAGTDGGTNPTTDGGGNNPTDGGGGNPNPGEPDGGVNNNLPDGGTSGLILDGGSGSLCVGAGALCSRQQGAACCTGVCGVDGRCPEPNNLCREAGAFCTTGGDCCTNSCIGNKCAATLCKDVGGACTIGEQCCSRTCSNGTCAAMPTAGCDVLGQACSSSAECCSQNCQNGVCARAWTCNANGDLCTKNSECCGNSCSVTDGGVGRCLVVTGGGGGGCTQDGNPCSSGTGCCSRTCVDLGYGATICQPVGGCKLTGNYCTSNAVCCGNIAPSNVMCESGRCNNGTSCNGTGNICGAGKLPDGGVLSINASQNCCDGQKEVCKVDMSGVPRCFGGGSIVGCPNGYTSTDPNCCIKPGTGAANTCQFTDQCCAGSLCLPDVNGNLKCTAPGSGTPSPDGGTTVCSPVGTRCDGDAGVVCCTGTECRTTSELTKACQSTTVTPPPDGGTGGTTDGGGTGGTCAANGSTCSGGAQCCSGICSSGTCVAPAVCQPETGLCTTNADCCSGLSCAVPQGSTVGSCTKGATCSSSGQACSPTAGCCSGLSCRNSFGGLCDGSSACTCRVVIN